MNYPSRALIQEPFACQLETIERALIDVQSQPSSYYGRRNNNGGNHLRQSSPALHNSSDLGHVSNQNMGANMGANLDAHMGSSMGISAQTPQNHNQQHYGKSVQSNNHGNFYSNNKYSYYQQNQQPQTQQSHHAMDVYGTNFRHSAVSGAGAPSVGPGPNLVNSGGSSGLHTSLASVSKTHHIPQVFNDERVFPISGSLAGNPGDSPAMMEAKKSDGLATFDPFGSEFSGYGSHASLFSPIFDSSSKILGSNYNSTSSNIWGNNSKGLAGDAAVWG